MSASEQIGRQFANGANVQRIWKDVIINVKEFGAKSLEESPSFDSTIAFQTAINAAIENSKSDIWIPPGTYKFGTLTNTSGITFYGDRVAIIGTTIVEIASFHSLLARINNIVASAGTSNTEIVDARQPETGTAFATLKNRLDYENQDVLIRLSTEQSARIADIATEQSNRIEAVSQEATARINGDAQEQAARVTAIASLSGRIDNIVAAPGTSNTEVVDARHSDTGTTYASLSARLDSEHTSVASSIDSLKLASTKNMYININAILPSDFAPTLPFNLVFDDDLNVTCDWDLNQFKTGADVTLYVNRLTGSDTTGDGTISKPYQFVFKAWDVLQTLAWTKAIINIDGEFKRGDMPSSGWTIPAGKTLSLIGEADGTTVIYSDRANLLTWTADGTSYKATRSSCFNVVDIKGTPDSNGIFAPLTQVTSVALCQSTPGSWYTDNVTVWVHTSDNRQPDIQVELVIANSELNFNLGAGATVYLEALNVRAGHVAPNGTNGQGRFVQKNVKISLAGGTQSNGLAVNNVKECYSFDCIAAYASDDGFNYHYASTPTPRQALAFESNCVGYSNGRDTGDQASTCHEGASIIRINGTYTGLTGTAITDVNGCDTVILGCKMTSTVGEAIRVSDVGSRLTMVNSKAFCQPAWASIRADYARLRNNIVNRSTNIATAELI